MKLPDIVDPEGEVTATVTDPELRLQQAEPVANQAPTAGPAQRFLERVVPWPGSAQAPGWINLHCRSKNANSAVNGGKDFVVGWPLKTVEDFLSRAARLETNSQYFDVWFCTSQQRECGKSDQGTAKAKRHAANATFVKAIWIDIDVKPDDATGKHYTSMREARAAMRAFRKKVGLPNPSAIVDSGSGLHVYWISRDPLTPDEWRPYADGLKALLTQEGVKCDIALTTDIVRLLRVPETLNHKYSPPRRVKLVHLGQMYNFTTELSVLRGVAPTSPAAKNVLALPWFR